MGSDDTDADVNADGGPLEALDALPDGLHVRTARRADLLDVLRLERECFPQPWPYTAFERFLGEPGFLVAVRRESGEVVGYVVSDVTPNHGRDIGHVKDLAVHPDLRRAGLGRLLLNRAIRTLAFDGAAVVKLEVRATNEPALSLYRATGFELLRRVPRYYEDGDDALVMLLDVAEWRADDPGPG